MESRQRKESSITLDQCNLPTPEIKIDSENLYPFALVLRLRVLQVVCGITSLVLGTVAFIEEKVLESRSEINLGLGMPAGVFTAIAAGMSVHTTRGFGGYKQPNCPVTLRFLGPRPSVAIILTLLWVLTCLLQSTLALISIFELATSPPASHIFVLAAILLSLACIVMGTVVLILSIDCRYDPD